MSVGFVDIGYSFPVVGDGNVYEGRGWRNAGANTENLYRRSFATAMIHAFKARLPNTNATTGNIMYKYLLAQY